MMSSGCLPRLASKTRSSKQSKRRRLKKTATQDPRRDSRRSTEAWPNTATRVVIMQRATVRTITDCEEPSMPSPSAPQHVQWKRRLAVLSGAGERIFRAYSLAMLPKRACMSEDSGDERLGRGQPPWP